MKPKQFLCLLPSLATFFWAGAAVAEPISPTTPISAIMKHVVTPGSDRLWNLGAAYYQDDANGEPPTLSEEEWRAADEARRSLTRATDALRTPGRPIDEPGAAAADPEAGFTPEQIAALIDSQRGAWEHEVQSMDTAMEDVRAAIADRSLEAFADAGNKLYDACESCHRRFWYSEQ